MNTLQKITNQDFIVSNAHVELDRLKRQYVREMRLYSNGSYILFPEHLHECLDKVLSGQIAQAHFVSNHDYVGIIYTIVAVNDNGVSQKNISGFHSRTEKQIELHPTLNSRINLKKK